ncbi:MAG: hypothetical protein R3Y58_01795 [Eubacteriales bacterium]
MSPTLMFDEISGGTRSAKDDATKIQGSLSADAMLKTNAYTPNGTSLIATVNITADMIEQFQPLNDIKLTQEHLKLVLFLTQLQSMYSTQALWPESTSMNGCHAIAVPDLLAPHIPYVENIEDLREDQILDCFKPFREIDGFPTVDGTPVWERLDNEPLLYYNAFKLYREMRYAYYDTSDALVVNRSLFVLAKAIRVPLKTLNHLAMLYQWSLRVEFYDMWMSAVQERRAGIKQKLALDRHAQLSKQLTNKAFSYLTKTIDKMSAKDALEMLKLGLQYERLSLGMFTDKPAGAAQSQGAQAPMLSIVNQTNNTTGPMQVNNTSKQQLDADLKKPENLLSILSVLQRSGSFDVMLDNELPKPDVVEVLDE